MRRRKRRRTMRNSEESWATAHDGAPLCVRGVCAVRRDRVCDAPERFNAQDIGKFLSISQNGLTISYEGPDDSEKNACSVRTHFPVPQAGSALFYFEVTVDDAGERGNIGVGLCGRHVKLEKMPGWEMGSFGYHGDDGLVFRQSGQTGNKYGPKYTTGDIVGCAYDMVEGLVFFTKNGASLGPAFEPPKDMPMYPTVGMQTKGGRLTANFGHTSFVYDIEGYARQQREQVLSRVRARSLETDYRLLENTVLGYLIHSGYAETASAFARDADKKSALDAERGAMLERQRVCRQVVAGDIDGALDALKTKFPAVLEAQNDEVCFLLHCQNFIEMIVSGVSPEQTVAYGNKTLSEFKQRSAYAQILEDVYSLLAYTNPASSPHGHLTKQCRREMVAEKLNAAILKSQGRATKSVLERLVCHAELVLDQALQQANGPFALVGVKDFL